MSRVNKHTVFLRKITPQHWTGQLVDDYRDFVANAPDKAGVIRQIKQYIALMEENNRLWAVSPEFESPTLRFVKVNLTPEYRKNRKMEVTKLSLPFQVPCIYGKSPYSGMQVQIPMLHLILSLNPDDNLEAMVESTVKKELQGKDPATLLGMISGEQCYLEIVRYTPRVRTEPKLETRFPKLSEVASPAASADLQRANRAWQREEEVRLLVRQLRLKPAAICLLGPSGCGKSSIIIEAAKVMGRTRSAESLASGEVEAGTPVVWITSASRLIAGMKWLGEWQNRLQEAISELASFNGWLFVENLRDLASRGGAGPEGSLAAFMLPFIRSGELRLITESTSEEMTSLEQALPSLPALLEIQRVEALSHSVMTKLMAKASDQFAAKHNVHFAKGVPDQASRLCSRFQPYSPRPKLALDLLRSAAIAAVDQKADTVDERLLHQAYSRTTGLPLHLLDRSSRLRASDVETWLSEQLKGQPEAVKIASRALAKFKEGLNDPNRPPAVLLFTGPTGTGKTQLAKLMADWLLPNLPPAQRLIRLDMSEYKSYGASMKLLGDPEKGGSDLIKRIRQQPFTVLLFDEIEKAGNEAFDVLLNVLEEGKLVDGLGRPTWFRSAFIIMTSNLGVRSMADMGFGGQAAFATVDEAAVKRHFRPEFFNRIDQMVTFRSLSPAPVAEIAKLELDQVFQRDGLRLRNISVELSDQVLTSVAEAGYHVLYGARPLQRAIEECVVAPLSKWLVANPQAHSMKLKLTWNKEKQAVNIAPT